MTCEQCYHCDVCWHRMTIYGPYALMGMSHGNMEVWCANCKPIPQPLHDELARYCAERAYDEEQ